MGLICPNNLTSWAFMNIRTNFLVFFVGFLSLTSCNRNAVTKILKSKDVEYKLGMAEQYYEDLFPLLRNDPRFEDLYFKYANCAFYQKDYMNSENLFKGFLEAFPKSTRASEVDYLRAYSFFKQSPRVELDQTSTQKTIGLMQAHLNNYPDSPKQQEAKNIIEECYEKLELKDFKSGNYIYKPVESLP